MLTCSVRGVLLVTIRRNMIPDSIGIVIPRLGLELNANATVATEVPLCRSAFMNRQTRILTGTTKRSTMSVGSVLLYLLIAKPSIDHFRQASLRLSGFPVGTVNCTSFRTGCIWGKEADPEYWNRSGQCWRYMSTWQDVELFTLLLSAGS